MTRQTTKVSAYDRRTFALLLTLLPQSRRCIGRIVRLAAGKVAR